MTGKQQTVMWMGFVLVVVKLITSGQGSSLWTTVTKTQPSVTAVPESQPTDPTPIQPPKTPTPA